MMTAYATLEMAVIATKQGAYDFLAKPFSPDELRNVVKKSCHHLVLKRKAKTAEADKRKLRFEFIHI